jgi:hypothetical protein
VRTGERVTQPLLAQQRLRAHLLCQKGLAIACCAGFAQVKVGGAKRLVAQLQATREIGAVFVVCQGIEVAPERGANKTHAVQHQRFALQPRNAELVADRAQPVMCGVEILCVVFMVPGHQQHRHRPASKLRQGGKALQAE